MSRRANDTIQYSFSNLESKQIYYSVDPDKIGKLTSGIQYSDTAEYTLANILSGQSSGSRFQQSFRLWRINRINVTFIPEKWTATDASGVLGEKPRIHWIQDAGETYSFIDPADANPASVQTIDQSEAEKFGKRIYKTAQFTKPIKLSFSPMKFRVDEKTISFNKWRPTTAAGNLTMLTGCHNLLYGFSAVPTGFKYKTIVSFSCVYKTPLGDPLT